MAAAVVAAGAELFAAELGAQAGITGVGFITPEEVGDGNTNGLGPHTMVGDDMGGDVSGTANGFDCPGV